MIPMLPLVALVALSSGGAIASPVIKPWGEVLLNYEMECAANEPSRSGLKLHIATVGDGATRTAAIKSNDPEFFPSGEYSPGRSALHVMLGSLADAPLYAEGFSIKSAARYYSIQYFYQSGEISKANLNVWDLNPPGSPRTLKGRVAAVPLTCQIRQGQQ